MPRGKQQRSQSGSNLVDGIDAGAAARSPAPIDSADKSPCGALPPAGSMAAKGSKSAIGSRQLNAVQVSHTAIPSLRDEVKEAMRNILRDPAASAAAKASAGRTLMEFFDDGSINSGRGRYPSEMSAEELDAEIGRESARLTKRL